MAAVPEYLSILFAIAFASVIVQGDGQENTTQPQLEIAISAAPHHVVVEKKSSLLLNCSIITSNTFGPLQYRWLKDGNLLPMDEVRKRMQIFTNGSLYIDPIVHRKREKSKLTDEGLYECVVGNEKGHVMARRVRVEVAGIARNFTQEPASVTAYSGGSVRFDCSIRAMPPATILWQKDKAQLHDDVRFFKLPSGVLQIHNVSHGDAGNYRCMATQNMNQLPSQVSNWKWSRQALLTVLPEVPRDVRMLATPKNVIAIVDDSVILECLADGMPAPNVKWRINGRDKSLTSRHELVGGSNMRISNVLAEDAAVYVCVVQKAKGGTLEFTATLTVQTFPVMIKAPESNRYPIVRTVSFLCEVEGSPKPEISWYFNGTPINVSKDLIRTELADENMKLLVFMVSQNNTGYYQCVAENSIGQVMAAAHLDIFVHKDAPPPPQNVTVTPMSSSMLLVEWDQEEAGLPILTFLIVYRLRDRYHRQEQVVQTGNMRALNITGLLPYTAYIISVRSINYKASSVQSNSVVGRTLEGVPRAMPTITVDSPQADVMRVSWDDLDPQDQGGIIVKYQLQYRPSSNLNALTTIDIDDPNPHPSEKESQGLCQRSFVFRTLSPAAL